MSEVPAAGAPLRGRPPAHSAMPFLLAMDVLERCGYQACDPQRFARAHAQQCCHLCHMPYASAHPAYPCPHWFLMPWPDLSGFGAIFETFGVAGVVHYLLVHARGGSPGHPPRAMIAGTRDAGALRLQLRVPARRWTLVLAADGRTLAVELHTRTRRRPRALLAPTSADVAIMGALVDAMDGA